MAHFAQIDDNGTVTNVIVVANEECRTPEGVESEALGIAFCQSLFGGRWVQTSYNSSIRKNYAGLGFKYDETRDAFIPPQPFPSWTLNENTCRWQASVEYPTDGKFYRWNENTLAWEPVE